MKTHLNMDKIALTLGAERAGKVAISGGDFGAMQLLADIEARFTVPVEPIIFVDGDDMVRGEVVHDPEHGWIGQVDWSTQDVWESYRVPPQ